jgi:hypothetical protein
MAAHDLELVRMNTKIFVDWNNEDLEIEGNCEVQHGRTRVAVVCARLRGKIDIMPMLSPCEIKMLEEKFVKEIELED